MQQQQSTSVVSVAEILLEPGVFMPSTIHTKQAGKGSTNIFSVATSNEVRTKEGIDN